MKKHILIVSGVFPPEPVTSAYLNYDLAVALSQDYDVTVLRPFPTRPIGTDYSKEIVTYEEPFKCIVIDSYTNPKSDIIGRTKETISFGRGCVKYIRDHHKNIDFIYNSSWQFFGYYLIARVARKYNIPYIVPIQDIYPESVIRPKIKSKWLGNFLYRCLLPIDKYYQKHAYRVRTITDEMAEYLSRTRKIPKDQYLIVNNWQNDKDFIFAPQSINNDNIVFGFVGSINTLSNVNLIIEAFAQANIDCSSLTILGGGSHLKDCKELAQRLKLTNIRFDKVPRSKVAYEQSKLDVLIVALPKGHASYCLPSKITSYMLSGKPIIASIDKPSAASRYIQEADCGIVVEPDNIVALSHAIKEISQMTPQRLEEIGRNSRRYALEHLGKDVNLKIIVDSINQLFN